MDKLFCGFEYCYLKSINRTYKYASLKVNLFQIPVTNFSVNLAVLKWSNGYRPFHYNFTTDGCKFLGNVKTRNPVGKYFFDFISPYANVNHKCPFNHDIIIDKVPITHMDYQLTKLIPFPKADYLFETTWFAYGIKRGSLKIYGKLS
ncbi:uncharacterized protein [Drosophila tropicalis]|uniref:uncharacterized protein n=1 Tax=Drosophila tropicalis TaxID=46794 RepID=UPI0035ABF363